MCKDCSTEIFLKEIRDATSQEIIIFINKDFKSLDSFKFFGQDTKTNKNKNNFLKYVTFRAKILQMFNSAKYQFIF